MLTHFTGLRLKPEQIKALQKISQREDRLVSWLIRKAIDEFIERDNQRKVKP
jgi:predicted transcriptional regulator